MSQLNIFGPPKVETRRPMLDGEVIRVENGEFLFVKGFFAKSEADRHLHELREGIAWRQESMYMYGKKVAFPRLTAWYGDNDKDYSFSGIKLSPHSWTDGLLKIRSKVEQFSKASFNSVLLNLYRNGNDSISWHTDAEPELGRNPVIASVSLGVTRKFQLRHVNGHGKLEIELTHGSLLLMRGELQHYWQHQIPKSKTVLSERVNLTFRLIMK